MNHQPYEYFCISTLFFDLSTLLFASSQHLTIQWWFIWLGTILRTPNFTLAQKDSPNYVPAFLGKTNTLPYPSILNDFPFVFERNLRILYFDKRNKCPHPEASWQGAWGREARAPPSVGNSEIFRKFGNFCEILYLFSLGACRFNH